MSKSREQINKWLKTIDVTGKSVLDVGAGSENQHVINYVQGKPIEFMACDLKLYKCNDFEIDLNLGKEGSIGELEFDYVFCIETLEHVWNPLEAINNLVTFTRDKLFITVPFINPLHDTHDYIRYTMQWFEKVLPMYGFDVEFIPRIATSGKNALEQFYSEEGLRMSKVTRKMGYWKHYTDIGYIIIATRCA